MVDDTLNGPGVYAKQVPICQLLGHTILLRSPIYPSRPISATTGLDDAGWILPEGETMRRFEENQPMVLRFLVYDTPTNRAVAESIERAMDGIGVAPQLLLFSDWRDYRQLLNAREFDVALVDVTPPGDPDLYDFWSQEAIISWAKLCRLESQAGK